MIASGDIIQLSNIISSKVEELNAYYKTADQLPLTNNTTPVLALRPPQMQTKIEIINAIDQLKTLIQDPMENLVTAFGFEQMHTIPALDIMVRYNIASKVNANEEINYQELSKTCGLNEPDLRRIMRMLISRGVFAEPRKGVVAHNDCSRLFHDSQMVADWLAFRLKYAWPASYLTASAIMKWPNSQEQHETAFHLLRGQSFWDSLKDEGNAKLFAAALRFMQNDPAFSSKHLIRDLEWDHRKGDCPKLMIDIGGHNGSIAADILRHYPVEKYIVQDLPEVIAAANVPSDLSGRLEFQQHDFFSPQPVTADVYLLRWIFHDWSDLYAGRIISNLIPALKPGARIVVNEVCMPDPGQIPRSAEAKLRSFDLWMKQAFNSKERELDEWVALFRGCDERFKLSRVKTSPGSALAVIEFKWET